MIFPVLLDLAFKTPVRPILHRERILSEIDPVTPRNTTARNIYSPIVRFLTPSKESEYSSYTVEVNKHVFGELW